MTLLAWIDADAGSTPVLGELLRTWSMPLIPLVSLAVGLALYLRGWRDARRTRSAELPAWRAICFVGGLAALWAALASPIDALDDYLLAAHMIQHFILMSIAPPLIMLGAPVVPLLRGMPRFAIRWLRPLFQSRRIRTALQVISHPVFAWIAMNVAYLGWHVPAMFELTFRSEQIHDFEHLCFFATALGFWWVVLEPWPAHSRWPRWAIIPYLLTADIVNTVLSATLAFSGRVLYPSYAVTPRVCFLSPLKDQVAAGAEMWVLNSLVMLVPAVVIAAQELSPKFLAAGQVESQVRSAVRG